MARKKRSGKNRKAAKEAAITQSSRPAKPLFRLIPVTMCLAGGLLCLKTIEIYQGGKKLSEELFIASVQAAPEEAQPEETRPEETAPAEKTTVAEDTKTEEHASEEGKESGETKPAAEAPAEPKDWVEERMDDMNPRERDVLESLAERRKKLDQLEKDISLREKVLEATEQRIDQKLVELNTMSKELKDLLVTYDKEEDAKISSLVKVYEAMKPKDAARIFDEMDMNILLMVVDRMSERRVAPILAAMSPQKAKDLTEQLADEQRARPAPPAEEGADKQYSPPLF